MSFWNAFAASSSSFNPALAWSLGNGGKGCLVIEFPFELDSGWYQEQPCTTFHTFQHRKERGGFQHEFIVLKLSNGSVCRVERTGDPNARLNALATQGSVAQDLAQCFASESEAHLDSSELISEVTLPCEFDIQDVLKICRAIKEGQKTRNYTLQVYNCYFFALAIQICLTRFVAHWENRECFEAWLSKVNETIEGLPKTNWALSSSRSSLHYHALFRIISIISTCDDHGDSLICDLEARLRDRLAARSQSVQQDLEYRVNNLLWHSTISSSLNEAIEEKAIEVVLDILQERIAKALGSTYSSLTSLSRNDQLPFVLTGLVARAGNIDWPKRHPTKAGCLKQKSEHQPRRGIITNLDFHASICSDTTTNAPIVPANWSYYSIQQAVQLMLHMAECVLGALHIILLGVWGIRLFTEAGKFSRVVIDERLDDMVVGLECSDTTTCADRDPKHVIQEVHALLSNQRATWNKNPWDSICHLIREQIQPRVSILELLGEAEPTIRVQFGEAKTELDVSVSYFQKHVTARIEIQAKAVESVWLGSSARIQVELEETLSQVWIMIREDAGITEKVVQMYDYCSFNDFYDIIALTTLWTVASNHRLVQNLELLSVQDLEAQVASWRERLPNLESRVQELLDVVSRPDAQLEAMTEYVRAKQELDQNKILFAKAQEILNDKQFQTTQAQAVDVNGPSQQQQQHAQQPYVDDLSQVQGTGGGVQIRLQESRVLELLPRQHYTPYRKSHNLTWVDALNIWVAKSKSELSWIEGFKREESNRATHIMTPVLTCIIYEYPNKDVQMRLQYAASARSDAIEGAKSAVRSRLNGKVLVDFYGRVEDTGVERSRCRYKIVDINYTCQLDAFVVIECQSEGRTKRHAQEKAAKLLLESESYCLVTGSPSSYR